ncbi:DinB family protein [Paenibacillus tarimensis]|uniref:DinB family protein n=1 Tax=Paenibacillus tarimensis TaxID=416012 RepID=UPI001F3500B9|nr:DinB family protein [Paenibacillus tarimensis]MCF2945970.1 DinB family protein [Paenibacillus tarimensis]
MYTTIQAFEAEWLNESAATARVMDSLTDESLNVRIAPDYRTLGQLAWHLVDSQHEMLHRAGLEFEAPHRLVGRLTGQAPSPDGQQDSGDEEGKYADLTPASAVVIAEAYRMTSRNMLAAVHKSWTDADLQVTQNMYGEDWPNGLTLKVLIMHEVHHRGQMTVLMRQAGLRIPDLYGPTREQWIEQGLMPLI